MNRARLVVRRDACRRQPRRRSAPRPSADRPADDADSRGQEVHAAVQGQADVEFTKPATKTRKDMVTTTFLVKNNATAPIARLTVDETWYDEAGGMVTGGKGVINAAPAGRGRHDQDRDAVQPEDEGEQLQLQPRQRHHQAARGSRS